MFTGITMKKVLAIAAFMASLPSVMLADFSSSQLTLHPRFPGTDPFIIEINGTWESDCHPGEQKPVVESFDGHKARIGFETIVVHITCNTVDTDYRVLVDMSDAVRKTKPLDDTLDVQISFGGDTWQQSVELFCPSDNDCGNLQARQQRLEPGLYHNPDLQNQGLLVTRQNAVMVIFPLVYDASGNSEWLFTGNKIVEDSFFTGISRPGGGDCFGCEPGQTQPSLTPIGYISVLFDRPGLLQVKVNNGLFTPYRRLVFGYNAFRVGPAGEHTLIDLAGRWGISENRGTNPPLGDLTEFFPGAFDIVIEDIVTADAEIVQDGQVTYRVDTPLGETLGRLACKGQTSPDGSTNICEFIDPDDAAEPLFLFYQDGPSSLSIEFERPLVAVGTAPGGKAVRLD